MFQKLKNYLSGTPKLQMKPDPEYALMMSAIQRSVDAKEYAHACFFDGSIGHGNDGSRC